MKFDTYLERNHLTDAAFARVIGVSREAVRRYRGGRIPTREIMRRIVDVTDGLVTPNDFHLDAAE